VFFKIYYYVIPKFHSNKSCFKLFRKVSIVQFLIFFRDIFFRCELNNNAVKHNRPIVSISIKRNFILFLWFIYSRIFFFSNSVKNYYKNLFFWEKKIKQEIRRGIELAYVTVKKITASDIDFWCLRVIINNYLSLVLRINFIA